MAKGRKHNKLNNQGFALVFVLTIISFIAILGVITTSTALLNVRMRGLNRDSDKNFYQLEIALDEIYAQTGRVSSEILKEEYATILAGLYKTNLDTNEKANDELKKQYMWKLVNKFHLKTTPATEAERTENCEHAAEVLKQFASSFVLDNQTAQNFTVTVESVTFQKEREGMKYIGLDDIYSGVSFDGLRLTYLNPETEIESSLTVDMKIDVPFVRFMNGGSTLFDYVLVANNGIIMGGASGRAAEHQFELNGNIYGDTITINNAATVSVDAGLITAAGNLTVNQGTLEIGQSTETQESKPKEPMEDRIPVGRNKVWATGIELNSQAILRAENTDFFIFDDMVLKNNNNHVVLNGGYYGYGNEGMEDKEIKTPNPSHSSSIILDGSKDILDLRGLDSLMLAGRAYLQFAGKDAAKSIYPLGESLAVKSTQSMYLIPEECIAVKTVDGTSQEAAMNPILFPQGDNSPASIEITVDTTNSILGSESDDEYKGTKGTYIATKNAMGKIEVTSKDADGLRQPAFFVVLDEKIYVYFNFESNAERSAYFKRYLETKGDSFEILLKKSDSGVYINQNGQLLTSGALCQVMGKDTGTEDQDKQIFELLSIGQDQVRTNLEWVDLGKQFRTSFENLKMNLAETKKVTGNRETETGGKNLLPMGNYVRFSAVDNLSGSIKKENLLISKDNVTLELNGISEGLIISGGDVRIIGNGIFNGLIMAAGNITIDGKGKVTLNADASTYEKLLEDEEISKYFYDYGDVPSTVLNNYEDFVTIENWSRSGLEK